MANSTPLLKAAIYLIKCGYKKEARPLLFNLLDFNPADEVAFLWYVDTIPDIRDRIYSMQDFIEDYPDSGYAKTGLKNLQNQYRLSVFSEEPISPSDEEDLYQKAESVDKRSWTPDEDVEAPGRAVAVEEVYSEEEDSWGRTSLPEDIEEESTSLGISAERLAPNESTEEQYTTAERADEWYSFPKDRGEEYLSTESLAEPLAAPEAADEQLVMPKTSDDQDFIPDWLKEAQLAEHEGQAVEHMGEELSQNEVAAYQAGIDEEEIRDDVSEQAVASPETIASMVSAAHSAPTKRPHQASPDEIIQRFRKGEQYPTYPQAGAEPLPPKVTSVKEEPVSRKKLLRILEICAIIIICCVGLAIIAYFAQPLLLGSAESTYANEMAPVLSGIYDWMNGPITDWNQAMDEQVFTDQSTTYRDLLSDQMAAGSSDVIVKARLLPIAKDVISQGSTILDKMNSVSIPTEINAAHQDVSSCIQYEIEYMANVVNFLQYNTIRDVGESRCGNFTTTYDEVRRFIDTNK